MLSNDIPAIAMQAFVIVMGLLVVLGTLVDIIHKKNVKYFFENAKKAKKNELLIGFGPNYDSPNLSFKGDLTEAASNLFSFLAKYQKNYSKLAIAPIPNIGIGRAINDRIKRASRN